MWLNHGRREISMRLVYRPAFIFTMGLIVQGIVMSTTISMGRTLSDDFLSAKVDRFSVHKISMVGALLLLGRQEKFPLGVEYIDQQAVSKTLTLNIKSSTIAGALNAIVKTGKGYRWNIRNGVIDISNANIPLIQETYSINGFHYLHYRIECLSS